MNPFDRAIGLIERNKDKEINCIPSPFARMSNFIPGIEPSTYTIVTASSGVGKTQFTDFFYLHTPIEFYFKNSDKLRLKVIYYSLEMSPTIKAIQWLSNKIYVDSGRVARHGVKSLMSIKTPISPEVLDMIKGYKEYYDWYYQVVEVRSGSVVPYTIYKEVSDFCRANGTMHQKDTFDSKYNSITGVDEKIPRKIDDYYEPNDPNLMVIVIIDHAAIVQKQKDNDKRENMELLSHYLLTLRNTYGITLISINQQAADQEAKDNYRRPTLSGLGDNKAVQRDVDYVLGLYDPARHNELIYSGYNMKRMNKNYRELLLLKARYGPSSISTDLFYDGAVEIFEELPKFDKNDSVAMQYAENWMQYAENLSAVI
jgi:replicative DNA helicase